MVGSTENGVTVMSEPDFKLIDQKVGLIGGTALVIGNVIAMTVFLLPAHLIAEGAGPSIAIAMVIVSLPVGLSILGNLQVGGAMPAAGGSYVYATRLIHPFFGFMLPWVVVPAIWAGQVYLAYGFAEFIRFYLDLYATFNIPIVVLMYGILIPFIILNILGIRLVAKVQLALVAVILGGMLIFIVPGAFHVDPANYTPMFPEGYGPFVVAIVSLSIALNGFGIATAMGEELKDPVKNIPRVLVASAAISVTLMAAVVILAVGVVPPEFYVRNGQPIEAGVAWAAMEFLPWWGGLLVAAAAVVGAFTSINALYIESSRAIMRAARDEVLPLWIADIHSDYGTPHRAILIIGAPALLLVPFKFSPVWLTVALAYAGMVGSVLSAYALWNLPKRFPDRYKYSLYKLPLPLLKGVAIVGATYGIIILLAVSVELWWMGIIVGTWMASAYPFYRWRVRKYREEYDVDLPERMKDLHDNEKVRARSGSSQEDSTNRSSTNSPGDDGSSATDDDSSPTTDDD